MTALLWLAGILSLGLLVYLVIRGASASLWGAVLLTKVTPGIGVLWHLARREYQAFATALAATVVIVGFGVLLRFVSEASPFAFGGS